MTQSMPEERAEGSAPPAPVHAAAEAPPWPAPWATHAPVAPPPAYALSMAYRLHLVLFPASCRQCGAVMAPGGTLAGGYPFLCDACWRQVPWMPQQHSCLRCGSLTAEPERRTCPRCAERDWALDGVRASCHYEGSVRRWLLQLKFHRYTSLTRLAGLLLAMNPAAAALLVPGALVTAVPLHRRRLRRRGFNQSHLLAHAWSEILRRNGLDAPRPAPRLLRRHRYTRPQLELAAAERPQNVAGAFSVPRPGRSWPVPRLTAATPVSPAGRHVVLVDDIMTTGSTLDACARTLKEAGALSVHAVVVARA